jgi:hypothetical protein
MRRIERARAFGRALGEILGEARLPETFVIGLSAIAFQAAALGRPVARLTPAEETLSASAGDLEGDPSAPALRRRHAVPAPPMWHAVAPIEGPKIPSAAPHGEAAPARASRVPKARPLAASHPLRGPPARPV